MEEVDYGSDFDLAPSPKKPRRGGMPPCLSHHCPTPITASLSSLPLSLSTAPLSSLPLSRDCPFML